MVYLSVRQSASEHVTLHEAIRTLVRPAALAADHLEFPNGMAITADGRTLLVAESLACRVSAYDIDEDGNLADRRV